MHAADTQKNIAPVKRDAGKKVGTGPENVKWKGSRHDEDGEDWHDREAGHKVKYILYQRTLGRPMRPIPHFMR